VKSRLISLMTLLFVIATFNVSAQVKLEMLLKESVERVPDIEVIMSKVQIPAKTSLAKHWHPGEEFAYVMNGSVILWQKGKQDTILKTGDAVKIPVKQIHTAITGEEGVTLLIFRLHHKGQPERVLVE